MLDEALAALSAILGGKKYILGNQPCIADACAFGFLDKCVSTPFAISGETEIVDSRAAHLWPSSAIQVPAPRVSAHLLICFNLGSCCMQYWK